MISCALWITEECNLRCKYCYEKNQFSEKKHLLGDMEDIYIFLQMILDKYEGEEMLITFHGGEPLLYFDKVKTIVSEMRRRFGDRISFGITTNGTILSDEMADFLLANFEDLSISVDGVKEIHDANRIFPSGKGSYDKVIQSLRYLARKRENIRVRMTITAKHVDYFYESIVFLYNAGFRYIVPEIAVNDHEWDDENFKRLLKEVERLISAGYGELPFLQRLVNGLYFLPKCNGGIKSFNISCSKDVYPCEYVVGNEKFKLGNVSNPSEIIKNGEKLREIYEIANQGECTDCSYRGLCESNRCKYLNYVNTGNLFKPSENQCHVEHLKYEIWRKHKCLI